MRISDWSSDVCSSDLPLLQERCASSVIAAQIVAALFYDARWNQREQPVHVRCTDEGRKPPRSGACGEGQKDGSRSEEHTSELQSLMRISYAVFCLKKNNKANTVTDTKRTTQIRAKEST